MFLFVIHKVDFQEFIKEIKDMCKELAQFHHHFIENWNFENLKLPHNERMG